MGLLSPWKDPLYIKRVWCLFEAWEVCRYERRITLDFVLPEREANDFIKRGLVLVDGTPAHLGQVVRVSQTVEMLPVAQHEQAQKVSIMLHKPKGFVSQDSDAKTAAAQQRLAIRCKERRIHIRASRSKRRVI